MPADSGREDAPWVKKPVLKLLCSRPSAFSQIREQISDLYGFMVSLTEGLKPTGRA